jgi:Ni/Fe-hydrogenase subunit HybB-like protein
MRSLALFLKWVAPVFLVVGAEVLLGAHVPADVLADPVLDSQNRFHGVAFTLYGVLLFLCATDLSRYAAVLRCPLAWWLSNALLKQGTT